MKVEHNIERIKYLLDLYKIPVDEFLAMISEGLVNEINIDEIFSNKIKVSHLKRIDKVFNKGLHYYLDPKAPEASKESSIFFRKESFNSDLNFGAKKIVNHFEEFKISLSTIAKLSNLNQRREFPIYSISDNPKKVAKEIRQKLYPNFTTDHKKFLKSLISRLAKFNILVFEFVEYWNQKEKANIDGFFLNPNVIVLKRQQNSLRREIFTLIHELGHFLLNQEEVEKVNYEILNKSQLSRIEIWCNDFAFYFLSGKYSEFLDNLKSANYENDYFHSDIQIISKRTNLSQLALYTRLLYQNKISSVDYSKIKQDAEDRYNERLANEIRQRELDKLQGKKSFARSPKPIKSPLLVSTIQTAFYEGVINEYDVCKQLNIKPEKLDKYLI